MAATGPGGRVAVVTGGASGIGRALGVELAARGCAVVLADRQIELAHEAAAAIGAEAAELDAQPAPVGGAARARAKDLV